MATFAIGQLVRCIRSDDETALVGNFGRITAEQEYMGLHVDYFYGDKAWHEYPERELEVVDAATWEAYLRQKFTDISRLHAEINNLRYALEHRDDTD